MWNLTTHLSALLLLLLSGSLVQGDDAPEQVSREALIQYIQQISGHLYKAMDNGYVTLESIRAVQSELMPAVAPMLSKPATPEELLEARNKIRDAVAPLLDNIQKSGGPGFPPKRKRRASQANRLINKE